MAKQTFTALQILTAAQQNALQANDYNQTVSTKTASYTLVAADVGTKIVMNAGATNTTITVNTSLFAAGDTLTILNTSTSGTCTITAGTATVASAGSLALGLNQGGTLYFTSTGVSVFQANGVTAAAGGFTFITGTSFTTATSVSLPASTFSATYANYQFVFDIQDSSTDIALTMRMRVGGTDNTTNNYNNGFTGLDNLSVTQTKVVSAGSAFALTDISTGVDRQVFNLMICNPFATQKTEINGFVGRQPSTLGGFCVMGGGGIFNATTSFDALTIIASTGTITGLYRVYGYANS